jgi:SAM-dependent methyltransferase
LVDFQKYFPRIKRRFPDYKFSWEIFTDIILEQARRETYWLDIGARNNILIEEQPGYNFALGLDIEKPAKFYTGENSSFGLASIYEIPLKDNSLDFITSRYTFEHLEFPEKALHEILRILKPEGVFLMQTTNKYNPFIVIARLIPFRIKKMILRILFKDNPSGTYKTYYRINRPSAIKNSYRPESGRSLLVLQDFILTEDILCHSDILFRISFPIYKILRLFKLNNLMGNMICVFKKVENPDK